jgi:hypothetical protein
MHSTVTVRTDSNHILGIIRPTVATTVQVMYFQEWLSLFVVEWRWITTALTDTVGMPKSEFLHYLRAWV